MKHAARDLAGDMPRLSAGDRLGGYELIDQIGAGGMGEVWRALDPPLRRHVAIKVLSSQYSRDPDRLRRFEQEAQAAGMLNHPNVLAIYAVGEQDQSPYLVTELLEGETLRHRLERGLIPEGKAIEYGDQVVQGLAAAHTKGIVHRDLKPENIFITADGHVKILDFGLAKLAPSRSEHQVQTQTASGIALGTPAYMSPEQVRGQAADHRSDIFSLGAVLYEMLSGRHPFLADTSVETMNAILKQDPRPLTGALPQLDQIVRHCLEKEPSDRYQSARDLGFQLRLVRHPSSPTPAPLPTSTRRGVGVAFVALMVLAVTVGVTWWLTRPAPQLPPPTFTGLAKRLTSGTSIETEPSVIAGPRIAFGSLTHALNVWNLPIAANNGKVAGAPEQVTTSAFDAKPTVSADGKELVFISERGGNPDLWMKDLTDGRETALTATPLHEEEPEITADGTRVFYMVSESAKTIYQLDTAGGVPEKLCDTCGRPWDSSPDGTQILFLIEEGRKHADLALGLFDTVRRHKTNYVVHPAYDLAKVRFSPDGRWISFVAINRTKGYRRRLIVAPFRRDLPPRDDEWIQITDENPVVVDKPSWSPDGSVLYYISEIDGFRCIWARRLDPKTKHPLGEPLAIYHSHSARRSLMNAAIPFLDLSVTADGLFFNLGEATGNIWLAEWKQ